MTNNNEALRNRLIGLTRAMLAALTCGANIDELDRFLQDNPPPIIKAGFWERCRRICDDAKYLRDTASEKQLKSAAEWVRNA